MSKGQEALKLFNDGYNCCQAVLLAFKDELNLSESILESLSSSFGGGVARLREVCGCVSAMAMIMGLLYGKYDKLDNEGKSKQYQRVQNLAFKFKEKTNSYICSELLNIEKKPSFYMAEIRTDNYYKNRPCGKYIEYMACLIEKEIIENGKN